MVECPRCGNRVDRLVRAAELLAGAGESARREGDGVEACRWCIHEVVEG